MMTYLGGEAGLDSCQHLVDEVWLESMSTNQASPQSFPTTIRMRFYVKEAAREGRTRQDE